MLIQICCSIAIYSAGPLCALPRYVRRSLYLCLLAYSLVAALGVIVPRQKLIPLIQIGIGEDLK